MGQGAAASTSASVTRCLLPVVIQLSLVHAPSALWIPCNFLLAWVCLLPVMEVHWELRTRTASAAFPQGLSPLQWKRFKYFGSCMSWKFGPEAHKSLTNIQFQITPRATGCDADHHIKHGRTMWKRVFQLKLRTCQANKYPSDLSAMGDLDAASEDTVSRTRMRMLSSAALACHAQPTKVKPSERNPARMTGGAEYPAASIPLPCSAPGRDGDHLPISATPTSEMSFPSNTCL